MNIGNIGNCYGGLAVKEENDKYYWGIKDWDGTYWGMKFLNIFMMLW